MKSRTVPRRTIRTPRPTRIRRSEMFLVKRGPGWSGMWAQPSTLGVGPEHARMAMADQDEHGPNGRAEWESSSKTASEDAELSRDEAHRRAVLESLSLMDKY